MSIRDFLNQNSAWTTIAAVLVLIFALGFSVCQLMPRGRGPQIKAVYFYDLTNGQLFTAAPSELAPIDVPSGTKVTYRKKELKAGLRAHVFSCGGCPDDMTGMTQEDITAAGANLAYLGRYTDQALEMHRKAMEQMDSTEGGPRMPGPMMMFDTMGRLIGKPPGKVGQYPKMYNQMEQAAANLQRKALEKCSDNTYPKQCIPGM